MQFGDLVFSKPQSIVGKLISYFSGKYSHVAIALDEYHLISALPNGITIYHIDVKDFVVKNISLTDVQKEKLKESLYTKIGNKYEYLALIYYLLEKYIKVDMKPFNNPDKYICSEFIYDEFNRVGLDLLPSHVGVISPTDLYEGT